MDSLPVGLDPQTLKCFYLVRKKFGFVFEQMLSHSSGLLER